MILILIYYNSFQYCDSKQWIFCFLNTFALNNPAAENCSIENRPNVTCIFNHFHENVKLEVKVNDWNLSLPISGEICGG